MSLPLTLQIRISQLGTGVAYTTSELGKPLGFVLVERTGHDPEPLPEGALADMLRAAHKAASAAIDPSVTLDDI